MLKDKVAVVTGGSRGIGKATAIALARQGCRVAICSKNMSSLEKAEHELKKYGISCMQCDISKPDEIRKFSSIIKNKFGGVDILVNNAGVAYCETLAEMSEKKIEETISVNVSGMILMTKSILPLMENGTIINISSGLGKTGSAGFAAYCASKFAVIGFTESLAQELKGTKVMAVCPGGVDTDMYMSMASKHPQLKPEHIAAKTLEICTEPHRFRTGSAVEVYHVTGELKVLRKKYFGQTE